MLAVDGEDHVLAFAGEDVEDDVSCSGTELDALCVEDLLGELGGRNDDEVALPHAEEEDIAEFLGEFGEVPVVEVVADLEPVAEDRHREGTGRELEAPAAEFGDGDGDDGGGEEGEEGLL